MMQICDDNMRNNEISDLWKRCFKIKEIKFVANLYNFEEADPIIL